MTFLLNSFIICFISNNKQMLYLHLVRISLFLLVFIWLACYCLCLCWRCCGILYDDWWIIRHDYIIAKLKLYRLYWKFYNAPIIEQHVDSQKQNYIINSPEPQNQAYYVTKLLCLIIAYSTGVFKWVKFIFLFHAIN